MNINQVVLTGNLVADPEVRATASGMQVAIFRVAVNDFFKSEKRAYFFDLKAFGRIAEIIRDYTKKGSPIAVTGKLVQETWETKENEKRQKVVVYVEKLELLNRRDSSGGANSSSHKKEEDIPENFGEEDQYNSANDLPF